MSIVKQDCQSVNDIKSNIIITHDRVEDLCRRTCLFVTSKHELTYRLDDAHHAEFDILDALIRLTISLFRRIILSPVISNPSRLNTQISLYRLYLFLYHEITK